MIINTETIKLIFGIKLRFLRLKKKISLQQLSKDSGMSLSYLSEIESGKKYPKNDKIILLSQVLEMPFEELVSLKVPKELQPVAELLQSDFFNHFPLEMFGLTPQKVLDIFSLNPEKFTAFIKTMLLIARNYEMNQEALYNAALRSYQEINNNYFKELEQLVLKIKSKYRYFNSIPLLPTNIKEILLNEFDIKIEEKGLQQFPALKNIRSFYDKKSRVLHLNNNLRDGQVNFILVRELIMHYLEFDPRPEATPPITEGGFDFLLNNYKASYLSAAIIIPEKDAIRDIKRFAAKKKWDPEHLIMLMSKYKATPEMLMQRLTNLLPEHFKINDLFFLRFVSDRDNPGEYRLTKELHLTRFHQPHANELNEHYCRRWISLGLLENIIKNKKTDELLVGAQISQYHQTDKEYLILTIAFPNASAPEQAISVSIGFLITNSLKKKIRYLNDPDIIHRVVNNTCERCSITDCKERAAPPTVVIKKKRKINMLESIEQLLNKEK